MRITHLTVKNYKSLREVSIEPQQLSVLVGANASGKTNFADCIDFISEVYRHGLEVAVARKGGYENIALRKMRRSKRALSIDICVELTADDLQPYFYYRPRSASAVLQLRHTFNFVARGSSIRADFKVVKEFIGVQEFADNHSRDLFTAVRENGLIKVEDSLNFEGENKQDEESWQRLEVDLENLRALSRNETILSSSELIVGPTRFFSMLLYTFSRVVGGMRVYQINPNKSREFGVPIPNPEMDRYGANLPAVVDAMKKNRREWNAVMRAMRNILPALRSIDVGYTTARTLGLFFDEQGMGRPWSASEVSDGTVQTLALLVAIFDPDSPLVVIEEPENSVHPWIIRHILEACREASKRKQVLLTTHSPIVMNAIRPEEVWVIWRVHGESHLESASTLDPSFLSMWEEGNIPTFEYIDSGALPQAIPPALEDELELVEEQA